MSGVYIPGMEMPESCAECLNIGWQYVFECNLDDVESGARLGSCPLIPVPDHGRLGDLDRLEKELVFDYAYAAADICKAAPTIIPADKEADNENHCRQDSGKPH